MWWKFCIFFKNHSPSKACQFKCLLYPSIVVLTEITTSWSRVMVPFHSRGNTRHWCQIIVELYNTCHIWRDYWLIIQLLSDGDRVVFVTDDCCLFVSILRLTHNENDSSYFVEYRENTQKQNFPQIYDHPLFVSLLRSVTDAVEIFGSELRPLVVLVNIRKSFVFKRVFPYGNRNWHVYNFWSSVSFLTMHISCSTVTGR